jgi:hypothetical protein
MCVTLAVMAVGLVSAKTLITQDAALASGVLTTLKFEAQSGNPKVIGAPPKFKVTKETIEYLDKLRKQGKTIDVQNNGSLKIGEAAK